MWMYKGGEERKKKQMSEKVQRKTDILIDPACWPERRRMPRQRIDVRTASHLRSSPSWRLFFLHPWDASWSDYSPRRHPGNSAACTLQHYQPGHQCLVKDTNPLGKLCSGRWNRRTCAISHYSSSPARHLPAIQGTELPWCGLQRGVSVFRPWSCNRFKFTNHSEICL